MKKYLITLLVFIVLGVGIFVYISINNDESGTSGTVNEIKQEKSHIVVYGDSRTGHDVHSSIVEGIVKKDPEVVFHTGDLVNDGTMANEWDTFNDIVAEMVKRADFYPALGNHEKNADYYFNNFTLPGNERWYSVNAGGATFIVLDSNSELSGNSEQYNWLEAELMKRKASDIIAVILHHPPYSTGEHEEDEKGARGTIVPLFEQYGVDIVFSGHDHTYERLIVNGIYYIVTGGAGAPLYDQTRESPYSVIFRKEYHFCFLEITNESLLVTVYTAELDVIDDFVVIESVVN